MNWIFPIAGKGKRTKSLGKFKPFVEINNKKIFEWCIQGIKNYINNKDTLYFITTKEFEKNFSVKKKIKKILLKNGIKSKVLFVILEKTPNGPGFTVKNILPYLKKNKPCIIINSDQYINFDLPKKIFSNKIYLPIYFNAHGKSSYVQINQKVEINKIVEKKQISFYGSSGVYIFGSSSLLKFSYKNFDIKILKKRELNISNLIDNLIKKYETKVYPIKTFCKFDLGDVSSIKKFKKLFYLKNLKY